MIFPLTASADVEINETNFPDENFREYLQRYGVNGIITDEEIKGITYIDVGGRSISNLQGIEHFTALTELNCTSNQLTSLDVSGCTALTELECYKNHLKGIAMDAFIESLPIKTSGKEYKLYIYRNSDDDNVCTRSQVAAIKEKGWIPYYYDYRQWLEYEGSDDDPSSITKPIIETENANTPVYNLSGQKVTNVKKGIYIVNGKKVIVK